MFSSPIWDAVRNSYFVSIINIDDFNYKEIRNKSSGTNFFNNPNVDSKEFQEAVFKFAEAVSKQGEQWFASPIKPSVFIKKVKNTFVKISENDNDYGNIVQFTWKPRSLEINSRSFEISWKVTYETIKDTVIPTNFINLSDEAEEIEPRNIIIQQNEILENIDIPFNNSEQELVEVNSRANFKKELHRLKLKAAIATMKAEKLAEKYFRRYGIDKEDDLGSDILFESDEENSDEE